MADLCISVQLTVQVASRDTITALLKDGGTAEESIQTGAEGLQIT
jgi:hypothetical protein